MKIPATKTRQASPATKTPMMSPILVDLLTSALGASRGGGFAVRLLSSVRSAGAVGCEGMTGRAIPRAARAARVMMKVSFILEFRVFLKLICWCGKSWWFISGLSLGRKYLRTRSTSTSFCVTVCSNFPFPCTYLRIHYPLRKQIRFKEKS
jgi:hypothetical protein